MLPKSPCQLICTVSRVELAMTALEKATRDQNYIILIGKFVSPARVQPKIELDNETITYLHIGLGRQRIAVKSWSFQ